MLGTPKEELQKTAECRKNTEGLRERFEDDYELARGDEFSIPKSEGKWENYTTNKSSTDSHKITNTLSDSKVHLRMPIGDETEGEREALSKTEQFVYGAIALRDSIFCTVPEVIGLHEAMSWFCPNRGWLVLRAYLYEDEETELLIPDLAVWDMLHTNWISGSRGIMWASYKRYASKQDVKKQYKEDIEPDNRGRIALHDIWDDDEEGVMLVDGKGSLKSDDWLYKHKHGIGHPPVLIIPVGSMPLIQSDRNDDTLKDVGVSFAVNNRELYKTMSRVRSYFMTFAGRAAKNATAGLYDSSKGGKPPLFEGDPNEKGAYVTLDIGKGQDLKPLAPHELTKDVYAFQQDVATELATGGMAPISMGLPPYPETASGTATIVHTSMANIKPFVKAMERGYVWLAHELVSQFKSGKFKKTEMRGVDGSNRRFQIEVSPDDIDDSWQFVATIKPDMPQDRIAEMGMATQAVESGILSHVTARDPFVPNPDLEQEKIDREFANNFAFIRARKVAAALAKDGDTEGAAYILEEIETRRREAQGGAGQEKGVASQPRIPSPVRPSGDTSAVVPKQQSVMRNLIGKITGR